MSAETEQLVDVGRGITLCAERLGSPDDPTVLLIMGLGQQLLAWPDEFCQAIVAQGFQVVRFDNRDIGRSTHVDIPPPKRAQLVTRRFDPDQYDLGDMAADTAALIERLEIFPVHAVGVSMGGMIAQTLAAQYPQHVASLVSIMSSTGARRSGWMAPSTMRLLFRPPARDRAGAEERALTMFHHIGSRGYPLDETSVRERAGLAFDRDPRAPAGTARQIAAVLKSGDRTRELRQIKTPTLVIHGDRDPMIHPSGGRATAAAIPGAELMTIRGMGHDLPAGAYERLIELITAHARKADDAPQPAAGV